MSATTRSPRNARKRGPPVNILPRDNNRLRCTVEAPTAGRIAKTQQVSREMPAANRSVRPPTCICTNHGIGSCELAPRYHGTDRSLMAEKI